LTEDSPRIFLRRDSSIPLVRSVAEAGSLDLNSCRVALRRSDHVSSTEPAPMIPIEIAKPTSAVLDL
jgi:hypothetical protein